METENTQNAENQAIANEIVALFSKMNGSNFVGIRTYRNQNNELANHVVIADFSYTNAVNKTVEILNTLSEADFTAIAQKYSVGNTSGILYSNSIQGNLYLTDGKLPKEGTKARETVLNSIKTSKSLVEMRNAIVAQFLANLNPETRSDASKSAIATYTHVTNSIKVCNETKRVHIYAMHHSKEIIEEGTYTDSTPYPETAQKNAIFAYCKYQLNSELPVSRYRNFIVEKEQMSSVKAKGEEIVLA